MLLDALFTLLAICVPAAPAFANEELAFDENEATAAPALAAALLTPLDPALTLLRIVKADVDAALNAETACVVLAVM